MPSVQISNAAEILLSKKAFVIHEYSSNFFNSWYSIPLGRLLFVEKGALHLKVTDRQLMVPAGYCAWIPAETAHEIWANTKTIVLRSVYFESSFCKNPCFRQLTVFNGSDLFCNMIRHTEKWNGLQGENEYEFTFATVLRQMMPDEMRKAFLIALPSTNHAGIQTLLNYIHQNFNKQLTVNDLIKAGNYSLRTLQRLFITETGIPFSTYLKYMRIIKAVEMLSTTSMRVSEISWAVGYSSVPTFTNTFKSVTGHRPDFFQAKQSSAIYTPIAE